MPVETIDLDFNNNRCAIDFKHEINLEGGAFISEEYAAFKGFKRGYRSPTSLDAIIKSTDHMRFASDFYKECFVTGFILGQEVYLTKDK